MPAYGVGSYFALGWCPPRDYLRPVPPRADRMRRRLGLAIFPPPPTMYPDLVAAVLGRLRSFNSGAVATAFGDTGAGSTNKFQHYYAQGQPTLPWLRIEEPLAVRQWVWGSLKYTEQGQLQISIFAQNPLQARQLGFQIAGNLGAGTSALDDPSLMFSEGTLMYFRLNRAQFMPPEAPGPGVASVSHRVLIFDYKFSGVA